MENKERIRTARVCEVNGEKGIGAISNGDGKQGSEKEEEKGYGKSKSTLKSFL
jgi:hypothetical protein